MKARSSPLGKYILAVATIAVCPLAVWVAISHGKLATVGLVGVLALAVAVYIGLRHPLWLYWAVAIVMGGLPFGYVPGVHVPLYLLFAAGVLLAALIHPTERRALSKLEVAVLLLILAAAVSVVATGISLIAILMFSRWAIATLVVIALLRLSRQNLARFGRFFVCAASANAVVGIAMATVDQEQRLLKPLKIFGYGIGAGLRENTALYVYSDEGSTIGRTIRLGGTWVLPNSAGFALTTALVMCLILFRGWVRTALSAVLLIALLLTLSRATIFSLVVGLLLVFIFHTMRSRDRQIAMGVVGLVAAGALLTPMIRDRVLASFASDDKGRSDRVKALQAFPDQLSGHWLFGLGWARPEFLSGEAAQSTNYVSNAPLLTVYRGGIITGLIFVAVLVIGCVMGYRALRSNWMPNAVFGGVFIGLAVVYMNLAQSVVDMPVMALQFSILLAFMFYVDQSREVPTVESDTHEFLGPSSRPIEVSTR